MTAHPNNSQRDTKDEEFEFNDVEPGERGALSRDAMGQLQANILSSTSPIRSKQFFLRFSGTGAFRTWLSKRAPNATAARDARTEHTNLFFTAAGLRKLGVPESVTEAMDASFTRGAHSPVTLTKLRDDIRDWGRHSDEWDAVVIRSATQQGATNELPAFAQGEDCFVEHGVSLDASLRPLDRQQDARFGHFGYRDGISNPVYTQRDYERIANNHNVELYDPRRKMSSLLVRDPLAPSATAFGSYLVFRKYRQNVTAFNERIERIAAEILERRALAGTPGSSITDAMGAMDPIGPVALGERFKQFAPFETGANPEGLRNLIYHWVIGRGRDGTVLPPLDPEQTLNGFSYATDPDGKHCPFHAHIRKVNPRGLTGDPKYEQRTAIARRGISYINPSDERDRGLLFWCAQASISDQFEYVQQRWANADGSDVSHHPTPDADALIGRIDETPFERATTPYPPGTTRYQRWKTTIDIDFNLWDVVHLIGSSYMFAPSLKGIEHLKALS